MKTNSRSRYYGILAALLFAVMLTACDRDDDYVFGADSAGAELAAEVGALILTHTTSEGAETITIFSDSRVTREPLHYNRPDTTTLSISAVDEQGNPMTLDPDLIRVNVGAGFGSGTPLDIERVDNFTVRLSRDDDPTQTVLNIDLFDLETRQKVWGPFEVRIRTS